MKIFVITGSPRKEGNSNILTESFIKGAKEKGHTVTRFDSAFKKVHPCIACEKCKPSTKCVFDDDFEAIKNEIIEADMIVFASPVYYYAMSAQIKTTIDRFYSIDEKLHSNKKAAVILAYADSAIETANLVLGNFKGMFEFLGWNNVQNIIAPSLWSMGDVNNTDFVQKAYEFGKSL